MAVVLTLIVLGFAAWAFLLVAFVIEAIARQAPEPTEDRSRGLLPRDFYHR